MKGKEQEPGTDTATAKEAVVQESQQSPKKTEAKKPVTKKTGDSRRPKKPDPGTTALSHDAQVADLPIIGRSTLFQVGKDEGAVGKDVPEHTTPVQYWEKRMERRPPARKVDHKVMVHEVQLALKEVGVPKIAPIAPPPMIAKDTLCVYPVGDHHLGMLSWPEETGGDYNLTIGTELLQKAFGYLLKNATNGSPALVIFLGDFLHFDSLEAVTPANRNLLDADSRFPLIARGATKLMVSTIDMCRQIHSHVHVIVEQGNHDPSSSVMLREMLAERYARLKSVTVDTRAGVFHYYRFGQVLIGTHHGDKVKKFDKLAQLMSWDVKKDWGETDHHHWITGHLHQDLVRDMPGCRVESVRILPPEDAWAHEMGYRQYREMKLIRFHALFGETARFIAKPQMLGDEDALAQTVPGITFQ